LESSRDAIAYINDGMHIYANQTYMNFLGYDDIDDLICIPVLDTLASECQEQFKEFSKGFSDNDSETTTRKPLNCVAKRSDDTEININVSLSKATYDGEDCMQIILQPEQDNAELEEKLKEISSQDLLTGLYNRQYFMEKLHTAKDKALNASENSCMYYLALDNFHELKSSMGIADTDIVLRDCQPAA
jgi:predicted signal transduction protein with EAL and GGDEF domain